ncbi:hypothetical protein KSP39_PZI003260 [Platanthera zijinensis]|uniref:AB hydrolase-1 domain-containing protein n=1 Tax=Platanthera zijinensis TaxID=2320716 RepID=A0AAP0BVP0_9ASPA
MGLSLIPILDAFARRAFTAAGLRPESIAVDSETTVHCWLPLSLPLSPGQNSNPQISKPVLLLIHGFGPKATLQWRAQVRVLSRHFDLIVPELLFFGGSTTSSPERSEMFQAKAMVALLEKLGIAGGGGVVGVVGTSYGGFVAYHVARMMGEGRIGKVVIASSDLGKEDEDDRALVERAGGVNSVVELMLPRTTGDLRKLLMLSIRWRPRFLPEFFLRDVLRNLFSDNLEQKIQLIKGVTLGNKDLFQLTPLPQDVLIVWGEHDSIFPLEKAFKLQMKLGDKAKLEILKNTSHVPQLELADKFNKILLNFLLGEDN